MGALRRLNGLDRRVLGPPIQLWAPEQLDRSTFWDANAGDVVVGFGTTERRYAMGCVREVKQVGGRGTYFFRCKGPGVKLFLASNERSRAFLATYLVDRLDHVTVDKITRFQLGIPFTPDRAAAWRRQNLLIAVSAAAAVLLVLGATVIGAVR